MLVEPLKGFPKMIQTALRDGKTEYALRLFKNDRYSEEIKNESWDLIPVITEHLTDENMCKNPELFKCCKHLLLLISEHSNLEEALLQFVAEVEEAKENSRFFALLDPLYEIICKIPTKKVNSLAWSFNAVETYLRKCKMPPDYEDFEGTEKFVVDNSEAVCNILLVYTEIQIFYAKFIDNLEINTDTVVKNVLRKFLIQLLGPPLSYFDMELLGDLKTNIREMAEDIVKMVFKTVSDPLMLVQMRNEPEHDELILPDPVCVANLYYLVYYEGICLEMVPKVYNFSYLFESLIHLCNLQKSDSNLLVSQTLKLACFIFDLSKGQNISHLFLDCDAHSSFCLKLSNVIIYNNVEAIRKKALLTFNGFLKCFEIKGKYLIISNMITEISHSGFKGYLITFYKDMLRNEFEFNEPNMSDCFKGSRLFTILRKFCCLSEKEETDLMDNSDQIVSSLNLLRYLTLRDKNNVTKFWDFSCTLRAIYLEPLRRGIELSRGHYKLEIKNINENSQLKNQQNLQNAAVSLRVHGKTLPQLDKEEKLIILNSSLTAFDVMHSLLSRVNELLEHKG